MARDMGASKAHVFGAVPPASKRGYDYQHFVCNWHYYVPESNLIEEWSFEGVDFDGLHPTECHLYEAKHGYDGFLEDDWAEGVPKLRKWAVLSARHIFDDMRDQARRQSVVVKPHYPDVKLTWVFSSMVTKLYVFNIFLNSRMVPPIDDEVRPFERGS
ncbi:MAG: Tox-REase-5 domain-containing protein [Tropicimonas sp.]|uniref:Tox-REase-5 domain-containing protein n=1 Tax=Tropicimonas sp. TaxID=2067044 RepID=UPI003A8830DF